MTRKMCFRKKPLGGFAGVAAILFAVGFVFILAGCGGSDDSGDPDAEEVKNLPNFEGDFVESEEEAATIALGSEAEIQGKIMTALWSPSNLGNVLKARAAASESTPFDSGDGVTGTYTADFNDDGSITANIDFTVNGTYDGYEIAGKGSIKATITDLLEETMSISETLKQDYTVSYSGKGMKVVIDGTLSGGGTSSDNFSSYNIHLKVYDNENVCKYDFTEKYPL